jgi:hypothetical protein
VLKHGVKLHQHSQVALPVAAVSRLALNVPPGQAFRRFMEAAPQHAPAVFARKNSVDVVALSRHAANDEVTQHLMIAWADQFSKTSSRSERETLLHAGVQVFAGYLHHIKFGHRMKPEEVDASRRAFMSAAAQHESPAAQANWALLFNEGMNPDLMLTDAERVVALADARGAAETRANNALGQQTGALGLLQGMLTSLLRDHTGDESSASSAILAMVVAGTALRSNEQIAHNTTVASNLSLAIGMTGAIAGFFPAAAAPAALLALLGTTLVNGVAASHASRHQTVLNAANRLGAALVLDTSMGGGELTPSAIVQSALLGIQGL